VESVPEDLVESLVALYANATSASSLILIEPTDQLPDVANNATAFGYRNAWLIWVWPFWTRTAGGAAVDGQRYSLRLSVDVHHSVDLVAHLPRSGGSDHMIMCDCTASVHVIVGSCTMCLHVIVCACGVTHCMLI